ncbi:hypothetical protein SNEBB_006516 [Seison nebaliae]|nr:hypothetical protein SNEBB_006516 [Seison nebaliae]
MINSNNNTDDMDTYENNNQRQSQIDSNGSTNNATSAMQPLFNTDMWAETDDDDDYGENEFCFCWCCWLFRDMRWLPIATAITTFTAAVVPYAVSCFQGHINWLGFPFISETAMFPPENAIFSEFVCITALMQLMTLYFRYKYVQALNLKKRFKIMNSICHMLSLVTFIGVTIFGNFQKNELPLIHYLGVTMAFNSGTAIFVLHLIITWHPPQNIANYDKIRQKRINLKRNLKHINKDIQHQLTVETERDHTFSTNIKHVRRAGDKDCNFGCGRADEVASYYHHRYTAYLRMRHLHEPDRVNWHLRVKFIRILINFGSVVCMVGTYVCFLWTKLIEYNILEAPKRLIPNEWHPDEAYWYMTNLIHYTDTLWDITSPTKNSPNILGSINLFRQPINITTAADNFNNIKEQYADKSSIQFYTVCNKFGAVFEWMTIVFYTFFLLTFVHEFNGLRFSTLIYCGATEDTKYNRRRIAHFNGDHEEFSRLNLADGTKEQEPTKKNNIQSNGKDIPLIMYVNKMAN